METNNMMTPPEQSPQQNPQGKGSPGALIGIIVIIVIILLGAFYFWGARETANVPPAGAPLNEGDTPSEIEADLRASDLEDLGSELEDINTELEAY